MLLLDSGWLRQEFTTIWADVCTPFGRDACVPAALQDAAAMLRDGKTVLVHCKRGRHRTGAFLGILKARAT